MKTSIYIEDGYTQVVLTPENDFEKTALDHIRSASSFDVKLGAFYSCRGGWVRHRSPGLDGYSRDDDSVMLIARREEPAK